MQGPTRPGFVGRHAELDALAAVLGAARAGTATSLLVSGEPGTGKSSLLAHARATVGEEWTVASATCIPTAGRVAPLLPLRSALRRVAGPGRSGPDLGADGALEAAFLVDAWVDDVSAAGPVLLLVDDLQWADEGTLDVLMYLLAGPAQRAVALVATLRRDALADGHPLHPWLAKALRLPGVRHHPLGPLTPEGTHELVAHVVGGEPHGSLVADVHDRAGGNPYLATLLASGRSPSARHLPDDLPDDLASAVLGPWHSLGPVARELCTALAVGGSPLSRAHLAELVGRDPGELNEHLADAIAHGVLDESSSGTFWFHHPLQAEGLATGGSASQRVDWHRRFAEFHRVGTVVGEADPAERLGALAVHLRGAGDRVGALDSAREAVAAAPGGTPQRLGLARDALSHLPDQVDAATRMALLQVLLDDAVALGDLALQARAVDDLLGLTGADDPLARSGLVLARAKLDILLLRPADRRAQCDEAVALAASSPGSWQHTAALATRAAMGWPDSEAVHRDADAAVSQHDPHTSPVGVAAVVDLARLVSSSLAGDMDAVARLAPVVRASAAEARDWWAWQAACNFEWGVWESLTPQGYVDAVEDLRRTSAEQGVPVAIRCSVDDLDLLRIERDGGWDDVAPTARTVIGWRVAPVNELFLRRRLALIDVRQGRLAEADEHLRCLHELLGSTHGVSVGVEAVESEAAWTRGDHVAGIAAALRGIDLRPVSGDQTEWLVPLAARHATDLALTTSDEQARTTGGALLERLRESFPVDPPTATAVVAGDYDDPSVAAFLRGPELVYTAEVARSRGWESTARLWTQAAEHLATQHLVWWEAYTRWRAAEAHLRGRRGKADRASAAVELRAAHRLATSLPAPPLVALVEQLATSARLPVDAPGALPVPRGQDPYGLTAREREVLAHLVAGRTYGEVAAALFLSEKTVSSHISNMLRKTGTANRVELAQLALRDDGAAGG